MDSGKASPAQVVNKAEIVIAGLGDTAPGQKQAAFPQGPKTSQPECTPALCYLLDASAHAISTQR